MTEKIQYEINKALSVLDRQLSTWLTQHLVIPKEVVLAVDPEGKNQKVFLLITDHTGQADSSYRVVLDQSSGMFGLECTISSGIQWYMGPYASLSDAVLAM